MKTIFLYLTVFAIALSIGLGAWYVGRKVNYSFAYKSLVEQTVRELVKPESLK